MFGVKKWVTNPRPETTFVNYACTVNVTNNLGGWNKIYCYLSTIGPRTSTQLPMSAIAIKKVEINGVKTKHVAMFTFHYQLMHLLIKTLSQFTFKTTHVKNVCDGYLKLI